MFGQMSLLDAVKVPNVASVPHRSPFRYPGGKTWLIPHVRTWLASLTMRPQAFCEPFCGGATVGLSALFDGLTDRLILIELDENVAAVWETILKGQAGELIDKIGQFRISHESVRDVLDHGYRSLADRAFATIVRNRVQRGGILAPGASLMKHGENGRGLASRWYPKTLQDRIKQIHDRRANITFVHGDGIDYMRKNADRDDMVFFVDPPYTVAGRRLYVHSDVDHEELFRVALTLCGDFLLTYDDSQPIRDLAARFGLDVHIVPMKNTHHRVMHELLIGPNLGWARA
jgi:DNA adenine methylase